MCRPTASDENIVSIAKNELEECGSRVLHGLQSTVQLQQQGFNQFRQGVKWPALEEPISKLKKFIQK